MTIYFKYKDLENHSKNYIFFDLGANIGKITEKVANLKNIKKIYVFEPVKKNFKILEKKFSTNKKIVLENKAVWIENSKMKFLVGAKNSHTNSKLEKVMLEGGYQKNKYSNSYEVECINICEYINNTKQKDCKVILKIDIEGSEYFVLPEIVQKDIIETIDIILIEFHKEQYTGQKKDILNSINNKNKNIKIYIEEKPGVFKKESFK